jgi:hypothetical protein
MLRPYFFSKPYLILVPRVLGNSRQPNYGLLSKRQKLPGTHPRKSQKKIDPPLGGKKRKREKVKKGKKG